MKIGLIGAGNMAGAIIASILEEHVLSPEQIAVYDVDQAKRERYAAAGHPVFACAEELICAVSTIILAIKPQTFPAVMPALKNAMTPSKLLVSIAAGIDAEYIQNGVGFPCKLVLVMPNTPLLVGEGATAMSRVAPATQEDFDEVAHIFSLGGVVQEVSNDQLNQIMAVHANTPAFVYLFAKTIVESAQKRGIDAEVANRLFCQTLIGSAKMMMETGKTHQELIDMVCSPGGTTLAGIATLEEQGFVSALQNAFDACIARAEELAQ